jgi:hypothetical protein
LIDPDNSVHIFFKDFFSVNSKLLNVVESRIENELDILIKDLNKNELEHFLKTIYTFIPYSTSIYKRTKLNICLLDLATCYRG